MIRRDTVVIGASAGGVDALQQLFAGLPADLPARILVVLHVPPMGTNALAAILDRAGPLPARAAQEGAHLTEGLILVARPDHHLVVLDDAVTLTRGPRENGHRPSVDVLFRSAARALGPRVIGVVLSGALDDGAVGLRTVLRHGGEGVVQDPDDAFVASMPQSAIATAAPAHVLPVRQIPALLSRLVAEAVPVPDPHQGGDPGTGLIATEVGMAALEPDAFKAPDRPGEPSGFSCPDCHGVLFRIVDDDVVRFRCRVGHAWSPASLVAKQGAAVEGALWMALRALEERAAMSADMARGAEASSAPLSAVRFADLAREAQGAAEVLRTLIEAGERDGEPEVSHG